MSRHLSELETLVRQLITEHRTLLKLLEVQQAAMKAFDLEKMEQATLDQESSRLRITSLETRRRLITDQMGKLLKVPGKLNLAKIADLHPHRKPEILKLRSELREIVQQVDARAHVAGKLGAAVLGHLNTVMRMVAGAVEKAGVYTKNGVPHVKSRIGVMEAVA